MEFFRRNKNQPDKKNEATEGHLLVERDEYGYPVGIVGIKPGDLVDQELWGKNKLEGFEAKIKKVGKTR
jgi:hypothetical protein